MRRLNLYSVIIFYKKLFKSDVDKSNLITTSKSQKDIKIWETSLSNVYRVKLLGIHLDKKLNVDYHVRQLCKKASNKHTLWQEFVNIYGQKTDWYLWKLS